MLTTERAHRALFAAEIRDSLQRQPRQLPAKYFYDPIGSALFEAICLLPWYRIARAESALLAARAQAIMEPFGPVADVVELGPGSGVKLATLIRHGAIPVAQVSLIDVSLAALEMARTNIASLAGTVRVHAGSYDDGLRQVPVRRTDRPLLVLFLGSNIGNFDRSSAHHLLQEVRRALRPGDGVLLGTDLIKPVGDLRLAYDDPLQITAAFNRNLLRRINDELGGTFELEAFTHRACWNDRERRIEMHLVSGRHQVVRVPAADFAFELASGESIWTESSYKYEPEDVLDMGAAAGFGRGDQWIDESARFALTRFAV
jgi:dimethylhistidine N-methyltransferase